eukprot:TRINITY_DN1131_c0_g1_i1.p1 TRINITY_DN1131_c0_g1~~TRINITY_DN1131_c0_g1_i1.p1  ORF type:complete len:163 (+),score=77.57 TRINITY_DN1131_c0_g1_i1:81-569(+)
MSQWGSEVTPEQEAKRRKGLPAAPETKQTKEGSVSYHQRREDCVDRFSITIDGDTTPIIEKVVEHAPHQYPHAGMPHNTTIIVDGEKAVTTMLSMKVCVHHEHKHKVAAALAKVVKACGISELTEETWQQVCRQLGAQELNQLHWYFFVNSITCPEAVQRHF